ncbi:MAG: phosphoenolpyruvate synthase [Magnetococcales bacterium]|nr:phosphoenolpyruvate synthase [Magnetococcales bacterium]
MSQDRLSRNSPISDALLANLRETAVDKITIDPRQELLREMVGHSAGVLKSLDTLLLELNHPFRNWRMILPELRVFMVKNVRRFLNHEKAPQAMPLMVEPFFLALDEVKDDRLAYNALEGLCIFLDRVMSVVKDHAPLIPVWNGILSQFNGLSDQYLFLLAQSYTPLKNSLVSLIKQATSASPDEVLTVLDPVTVRSLSVRMYMITYRYWLDQTDPASFSPEIHLDSLARISHPALEQYRRDLNRLEGMASTSGFLEPKAAFVHLFDLFSLPSFLDIIRNYRDTAQQLGQCLAKEDSLENGARRMAIRRLRFMFHILEVEGLLLIHEETLREVNRSLVHLVKLRQSQGDLVAFFDRTFCFLNANVERYPQTTLQCIEVLGTEVFKHQNSYLIEAFLEQAVRFGFQYSYVKGVGSDWQPILNPAHLYNIRVWLNLIVQHPWWYSTLLSALIINMRLTGTCIRDTDLFQKEITKLLNSTIQPVFNLVKQFTRQLPVYYNEIGAEGALRDVSTELDELHRRKDSLIHFLRKQCHVESTNLTVHLVKAVFQFWRKKDRTGLGPFIPEALLEDVHAHGEYFDDVHTIIKALHDEGAFQQEEELYNWDLKEAKERINAFSNTSSTERRRVYLLLRLYQLLNHKYNLGHHGLRVMLEEAAQAGVQDAERLIPLLTDDKNTRFERLDLLLSVLEALKEVILSAEKFPAVEEIFQKRHIAVGIPSVYGRYNERKFDSLSLSFRLENLARIELEKLSSKIPEKFITRGVFFRVVKYLQFFLRALALDGVSSRKLTNQLDTLKRALDLNQFSFHQYLDIFKGFSDGVKDVVYTYYTSHHRDNLAAIVPHIPKDALINKYQMLRDSDTAATLERISEAFIRDMMSETFGLQAFDNFITHVGWALAEQERELTPAALNELMTYDPVRLFCNIHRPYRLSANLISLGNKGFQLSELVNHGCPVPPGFVLTTEYYRCRKLIRSYLPAQNDYIKQLKQHVKLIEQQTDSQFGSPDTPLLLSVRSGALISMPGMMQTVHNVGITPEIVLNLEKTSGFFAWDNYRRFIQSWSMSFGVERSVFNNLMRSAKSHHGIAKKKEFTPGQMRNLAYAYLDAAADQGVVIPIDPWEQLTYAILRVLQSWQTPKAREYRRLLGISNEWGTAVVIQNMVYGNIGEHTGSGVLFTAHPHRKLNRVVLWGDYTTCSQGEDIVGGLVATRPISREQCQYTGRDPDMSLEVCFPQIFKRLLTISRDLVYEKHWNPQEIEFTFDGPEHDNLFLLQTRDMVTVKTRHAIIQAFKNSQALESVRLARGLGVSGGALCGRVVFNQKQIDSLKSKDPDVPLILVRYDTVPDDIRHISRTLGLLTARGGQTSHAAVVAARLEKTCVVGCERLTIHRDKTSCDISGTTFKMGDYISIDGLSGMIYKGKHEIVSSFSTAGGSTDV